MSVDKFLHLRYDERNYNCAHFFCDAWEELVGFSVREALQGFLAPPSERRAELGTIKRAFTRLDGPRSPCLVLMDRPHTAPHVGLFYEGRVLHILESGVQYMPVHIATFGFRLVRYYGYTNRNYS
jgi:hypothetical protein